MHPVIWLISTVFWLLNAAVIVWIVLRLLIQFEIVNRFNPIVSQINLSLTKLLDPILNPIRRILPDLGGIDLSPLVLILALNFVEQTVYYYL